jgi:hypothetical protein
MRARQREFKVINVTQLNLLGIEGTRLASATPTVSPLPGCVDPNYLKCHL